MVRIEAKKKEVDGKTFYFLEIGRREHGRSDMIVWVSSKLVKVEETEYVEFPVRDARVIETEKGTKVLKPAMCWNTFFILVPSGYRGGSKITIIEPREFEVLWFERYASPRGSLGISSGAIVCTQSERVVYSWRRTGRLYGKPEKGVSIIDITGEEKTFPEIVELSDLAELELD